MKINVRYIRKQVMLFLGNTYPNNPDVSFGCVDFERLKSYYDSVLQYNINNKLEPGIYSVQVSLINRSNRCENGGRVARHAVVMLLPDTVLEKTFE